MAVTDTTLINAGIQAGLLDNEDLVKYRILARRERMKLIDVVTREGRFPMSALYQSLADFRNLPYVSSKDVVAHQESLNKLPANLVQRRRFLPVRGKDGEIVLALSDPDDQVTLDSARRILGGGIKPALADPVTLDTVIRRLLLGAGGGVEEDGTTDSIGLLDDIMKEAYLYKASDIHFEPDRSGMRVRLRVDGYLQEYRRQLLPNEAESIITRIKVLANMDISEQRAAQDGGFSYEMQDWDIPQTDIRVATLPCRYGERATLRILGQDTSSLSLGQLGMADDILKEFKKAIRMPHGIILITGPTGSGKSTTLYAALRELNADELNILTVEDPIEQIIPGISQVQVSNKLGFAKTLRSFLRHDPDVMLVGEIRDIETADTALKAAMTGHLVLSTLHTNDVAGAITRLGDIGCEEYLIASTVIGVMSQRLVRRLCVECREEYSPSDSEKKALDIGLHSEGKLCRAKGCPLCLGTGYRGRVGLYGALWVDAELAKQITEKATEQQIRDSANHYYPMILDGRHKVLDGLTSLDEIQRIGLVRETVNG